MGCVKNREIRLSLSGAIKIFGILYENQVGRKSRAVGREWAFCTPTYPQSRNSSDMSVTSDTFQLCISSSPAGPQSAVAQHATPSKGATRRHSSTAILSSALLKKGASEPRGHGSRQPELASREDAFKSPASEKPAQAECWSGSLATRVRVIRRSHRAARRYEHVWRQTRRIRLRWGRHPSADKARALLE